MKKNEIEVVLSPLLFPSRKIKDDFSVVIVDILRATTTICAALHHGVKEIIPVDTVERAYSYKDCGYLLAGERLETSLGRADLGNSALEFTDGKLKGKTIVHTTTNGTQAIVLAQQSGAENIFIGAFSNITALAEHLQSLSQNIVLLCSGWKGRFCLEDTIFCGALSERILQGETHIVRNDATLAAMCLWEKAKENPLRFLDNAEHVHRLRKLGYDDVFEFTFQNDTCPVVPCVKGRVIVDIRT